MPCNMIEIKPVNTIRSFIAKKIRRFRHLISLPLKKVVGMTGLEPCIQTTDNQCFNFIVTRFSNKYGE